MDGLTHDSDDRHLNPDITVRRMARFKAGWNDATDRNKTYGTVALERLTWQNLGYRIGKILGGASDTVQEDMYQLCVRQQRERTLTITDEGEE